MFRCISLNASLTLWLVVSIKTKHAHIHIMCMCVCKSNWFGWLDFVIKYVGASFSRRIARLLPIHFCVAFFIHPIFIILNYIFLVDLLPLLRLWLFPMAACSMFILVFLVYWQCIVYKCFCCLFTVVVFIFVYFFHWQLRTRLPQN